MASPMSVLRNPYNSQLHQFLRSYVVRSGRKLPFNLNAFGGGLWKVPDEQWPRFLELYAQEHARFAFSFNEQKREVFPMLMDLDGLEKYPARSPVAFVKQVLGALEGVLGGAGHATGRVLVAHRDGIRFHLVFPDLPVDRDIGCAIRDRVVAALAAEDPDVDWETVVDGSVTKANGLRMLGSWKRADGVIQTDKGVYSPCEVDFDAGTITTLPTDLAALQRFAIYLLGDLPAVLTGFGPAGAAGGKKGRPKKAAVAKAAGKARPKKSKTVNGSGEEAGGATEDARAGDEPVQAAEGSGSTGTGGTGGATESEEDSEDEEEGEVLTAADVVLFAKLERVVMALRGSRAISYHTWAPIIMAIWNVGDRGGYKRKARELVHAFSAQAQEKYDENEVERFLEGLTTRPLGEGLHFGSLMHLLREDNPEVFAEVAPAAAARAAGAADRSYEAVKEEFEKTHFKIMDPLLFATIVQEAGEPERLLLRRRRDFMDAYVNVYYSEYDAKSKTTVKKPFTQRWEKDEAIRTYIRMDMLPPPCAVPEGVYNTFPGLRGDYLLRKFSSDDLDAVDLKPIMEHLRLLCEASDDCFHYTLHWLAHLVQRPGELSRTAIVMYSEAEGVGKNVLWDWFGKEVLGEQFYFYTSDINQLYGRFGNGLKNALLANLDEANGRDTFTYSDRIKASITQPTLQIEEKGINAMTVRNCARFIITSNSSTPTKVGHKDRRFVCMQCSEGHANDAAYFKQLLEWMRNELHAAAFFKHLKSLCVDDIDWVNDRPRTRLWEDLRSVNLPLEARFLEAAVTELGLEGVWMPTAELLGNFERWAERNKFKASYNSIQFGRLIRKYAGVSVRKVSTTQLRLDKTAIVDGLREKGYTQPDYLSDE